MFSWQEVAIAFAGAIVLIAFSVAAGVSESNKPDSPEYWHYKHHQSAGTAADCTSSCQFKPKEGPTGNIEDH